MEVISPDLSAQVSWNEQGIFTSYQGNLVTDMDAQQGFTENLLQSAPRRAGFRNTPSTCALSTKPQNDRNVGLSPLFGLKEILIVLKSSAFHGALLLQLSRNGCNSRPGTGSLHPVAIEAAAEATKLSELSV
jgi:hypothetical protein